MIRKFFLLTFLALALSLAGTTSARAEVWDAPSGEGIEEQLNDGGLDSGSSDLELVYEDYPGTPQMIGLRFLNVNVPRGATIANAWIQFLADNEKLTGGVVNLAIWGRLEPNPGAFAAARSVSTAPKTSVYVSWSNIPDWASGARGPLQQTPNLAVVIQELVNQPGWAAGNALALIIGDDPVNKSTNIRSVQSGSLALHIEFSNIYAYNPVPADGSYYGATWASLGWQPGQTAASHDVYFGENFNDVLNGTGGTFRGNQSLGEMFLAVGYAGGLYPAGMVPGATYYWRIDEVEANGTTKYRGFVWSFTITPRTAYNPNPADGAGFVDPSTVLSWAAGLGAKLHYVFMGTDFNTVKNATAGIPTPLATYKPAAPLQLEKVYYWRVDEFAVPLSYKGDIWAFTTPGAVGNPQPANGATGASMLAKLTWTPATNAASHQVYFGTSKDAVYSATTASPEYKGNKTRGSETYDPGKLAWNSSYYWRVDEIYSANPNQPVKGLVWSFTTADFISVDDFESYNDLDETNPASNRIFLKWIDGYGTTTNGSVVSNMNPPFAEQGIVHSGIQSMPFAYDNNLKTSEATLTLVYPRNWTEEGVAQLSLWFRGSAANAAERMYVALNGSAVVYNDNPDALKAAKWTQWIIPLKSFADQGVNLTNVNTITLGFGTKNSPKAGGSGKVYFDDIRLYRPSTP